MIPGNFLGCEAETISGMKLGRAIFEHAKPDLGTGEILKDGNSFSSLLLDDPDAAYDGLVFAYRPVREVEPKDIRAGLHQLAKHLGRFGSGTNGTNDLCATHDDNPIALTSC